MVRKRTIYGKERALLGSCLALINTSIFAAIKRKRAAGQNVFHFVRAMRKTVGLSHKGCCEGIPLDA